LSADGSADTSAREPGADRAEWCAANLRYLGAVLGQLHALIDERLANDGSDAARGTIAQATAALSEARQTMRAPPAFEHLCTAFGLTPFERSLLLLCAAAELSPGGVERLEAGSRPRGGAPTFNAALAMLPGAHWSAITPDGTLRRFRLVEVGQGETLTLSPLRIDERVLHYIVGSESIDARVAVHLQRLRAPSDPLPPSHRTIVAGVVSSLRGARAGSPPPLIQLVGLEGVGRRAIAASATDALDLNAYFLSPPALTPGFDLEAFAKTLAREMILGAMALVIDGDGLDGVDPSARSAIGSLIDRLDGPVLVTLRERRRMGGRTILPFEVRGPRPEEQRELWKRSIATTWSASTEDAAAIDSLVAHFDLGAAAIRSACTSAKASNAVAVAGGAASDLTSSLWSACRAESRPRLDELSQRIESSAVWDDLVLPEAQCESLRQIALHVRNRARVHEAWGFAAKGRRGLGISALFAGGSGLGKTMAAEVLAGELRLDLYRVDLSQVVSKYIGETEKNLRRIFDAAESGGAILLFDEADALFGKRSDVKDSHDRFANIEVSYLLQRMEAFGGLAVLTTNLKGALDPAFMRRIRFIVQFPFPSAAQRAAIWQRVFPRGTPTEGLDSEQLARMNVAGGNIRNIALNAAFLAAEDGTPVRMAHVMRAARTEYAKLDRALTATEMTVVA
jgi:AAA+ superfamily predicted ATPase